MATGVTGKKGDFVAFECAEDVGVGRITIWRVEADFFTRFKTGHGVETTAADDSNFCFLLTQTSSPMISELVRLRRHPRKRGEQMSIDDRRRRGGAH